MTEKTPAERLAAGYAVTDHEHRNVKSSAALHDPAALADLQATTARLAAEGIPVPTNTRISLGYAQGYAQAAQITDQTR